MKKSITFVKSTYGLIKNDYWTIVAANLGIAVLFYKFNFNDVLEGILIFCAFIHSIAFIGNASVMPSINTDSDRFSWKYLQSLNLTKAELILSLAALNIFTTSALLVCFLFYFPQISAMMEWENYDVAYFVVAFYIPVMAIISFYSIEKRIIYPRVQFSKTKNRNAYRYTRNVLLVVVALFYLYLGVDIYCEFNEFKIPEPVVTFIEKTFSTLFSWWGLLPVIALAIYSFQYTLKIWQKEEYGYDKVIWTPKRDLTVIGFTIALIGLPILTYDFRTPDYFKDGSFQKSVYLKDWAAVKKLVDNGADVNAPNKYGVSAFHVAALTGNLEMYKFLEANGGNKKLLMKGKRYFTHRGYDILKAAVESNSPALIKHILQSGYDPNVTTGKLNETALHLAAEDCRNEALDLLIEYGAKVDVQNKEGQTPLHLSAKRYGCLVTVSSLIESGAKTNIVDKHGKIPLQMVGNNEEKRYYLEKKTRAPASIKK